MKISVTRKNIDEGHINDMCSCPVALAIKKQIRAEVEVEVESEEIRMGYNLDDEGTSLRTPVTASDFIETFDSLENDDDRSSLQPFEIELDIPSEFLKEPTS